MRLALFAGVHANVVALEAVLADFGRHRVDSAVDLGDAIGYGPRPAEAAALVVKRNFEGLRGAFETAAFTETHVPRTAFGSEAAHARFLEAASWARAKVARGDAAKLAARAPSRRLAAAGLRVVLAHGSTASPFERVPSTADERLLGRHLDAARADLLVLGHGDQAFERDVAGRRVVWCGSVGRARDAAGRRTPEASWCVLDTDTGAVERHASAYDLAAVERDTLKSGAPDPAV